MNRQPLLTESKVAQARPTAPSRGRPKRPKHRPKSAKVFIAVTRIMERRGIWTFFWARNTALLTTSR